MDRVDRVFSMSPPVKSGWHFTLAAPTFEFRNHPPFIPGRRDPAAMSHSMVFNFAQRLALEPVSCLGPERLFFCRHKLCATLKVAGNATDGSSGCVDCRVRILVLKY